MYQPLSRRGNKPSSEDVIANAHPNRAHDPSIANRVVFTVLMGLNLWYYLHNLGSQCESTTSSSTSLQYHLLRWCGIIYILRVFVSMNIFLFQRAMLMKAAILVNIFFLLVFTSYSKLSVISTDTPESPLRQASHYLGLFFYVIGSVLNTFSEGHRWVWKMDAAHTGKIFTLGLWSHSRHVNYLGDILVFFGWALLTHSQFEINLWAPLFVLHGFLTKYIPENEAYLQSRYGEQFRQYCQSTKWLLLPFVY